MSDNVHHQEQANEIAQAVQNALDSSLSEQQNITINLNYSPVYNNYNNYNNSYNTTTTNNHNGDNISLYSSSSSSNINIGIQNTEHNHYNQPLRIQTKPFLKTTVYDSNEVTYNTVLQIYPPNCLVSKTFLFRWQNEN